MTHYLRFPNEKAGMAALDAAGLLTEDGDPLTASHTHALDIVATITRGGAYNPETGEQLTPPTALSGWHVNYIGDLPDGWDAYLVTPEQPVRVWA